MKISRSELLKLREILPTSFTDKECEDYLFNHKELFTEIAIDIDEIENIINTNTVKGTLIKYFVKIGEYNYYVKSSRFEYGIFSGFEPESEYISFIIGKELGIDICEVILSNATILNKNVRVSCSRVELGLNEVLETISNYLPKQIPNNVDLFKLIIYEFPLVEDSLYKMICFDFIINNVDRHLNNFGVRRDILTNRYKLYSMYDNGLSLFADLSDSELNRNFLVLDKNSKSMPFKSRHYKQIKIVPKNKLIYLKDLNKIYECIDAIDSISTIRKDVIKKLLYTRNSHIKELINNG